MADETLIVAEKPSVARDIARVVGAKAKADGAFTGGGYVVTWALGHLVALCDPDEIDPKYKKWNAADLPILREYPHQGAAQDARAVLRGEKVDEGGRGRPDHLRHRQRPGGRTDSSG
jgi:DNA topoisomerase-3